MAENKTVALTIVENAPAATAYDCKSLSAENKALQTTNGPAVKEPKQESGKEDIKGDEAPASSPLPDLRDRTRKRSVDALEDVSADGLPLKTVGAPSQPKITTEIQKTTASSQTQGPAKRRFRPRAPVRKPSSATKPGGPKNGGK
ncbi:hypothetical protein OE88DRAFT_1809927 [Heliocybe sulcata]|uniref:Uncharacterized protein n=1 Tax=Heliocybe sulcata TaxID=5364 RepID=A0A5C3N5K1_9AGAM|nr:hypothetical protein OE88DRAFT_1809927 [Heliocybe sulcata]